MMEADFDKPFFKIEIIVYENGQTMQTTTFNDRKVSYQEIVGALECMQQNMIWDQSGINADKYRQWLKNQENEKKEDGK